MRRMIVCACVTAIFAGLLAAPADARIRHFHGTVNVGGTVKFDLKFRHGKARRAGAFSFKNVPERCDEGTIRVTTSTANFVKIRHRKFHYRFRGVTAHLDGKLTHRGRKAHGVFSDGPNDIGVAPDVHHDCHTGSDAFAREVGWKAVR
jgi:hypothetical protein